MEIVQLPCIASSELECLAISPPFILKFIPLSYLFLSTVIGSTCQCNQNNLTLIPSKVAHADAINQNISLSCLLNNTPGTPLCIHRLSIQNQDQRHIHGDRFMGGTLIHVTPSLEYTYLNKQILMKDHFLVPFNELLRLARRVLLVMPLLYHLQESRGTFLGGLPKLPGLLLDMCLLKWLPELCVLADFCSLGFKNLKSFIFFKTSKS